jgi:hypothetical protein
MRRLLPVAAIAVGFGLPQAAWCCGGQAGASVAISYDGGKYTVANIGRQWVDIVFTAGNETYSLRLAPGQADTPRSPGMLGQSMQGYQSCVATVVPTR